MTVFWQTVAAAFLLGAIVGAVVATAIHAEWVARRELREMRHPSWIKVSARRPRGDR